MKVLKQNILNFNIVNKLVVKKVLNILLYNKILVRTFDMAFAKKKTCVLKRSTMLKVIADNYSTFFLLSPKRLPLAYQNFNKLSQLNLEDSYLNGLKHLYTFKLLKNYAEYPGYSYKVCDTAVINSGTKYPKHRGLAYSVPQGKFIQLLKKFFEYFLALCQYSTVLLLLSPLCGGYKSYSRGLIGMVGFKQIKFFLLSLKNNALFLKKVKSFLILYCKLVYEGELLFILYFQSNVFNTRRPFFFSFSVLEGCDIEDEKVFLKEHDTLGCLIKKRLEEMKIAELEYQRLLKKALKLEIKQEFEPIIIDAADEATEEEEGKHSDGGVVALEEVVEPVVALFDPVQESVVERDGVQKKVSCAGYLFQMWQDTFTLELLLLKEYYK